MRKAIKLILLGVGIVIISTFFIVNLYNFTINKYRLTITLNLFEVIKDNQTLIIGIILILSLFILFMMKYNFSMNLKSNNEMPNKSGSNEYGSASWAKKRELKRFKVWEIGSSLKSGGIIVTNEKNNFYYGDSSNHTLVIGSTGTGKTVSTIMPLIFNLADASESMVINDSKGELLKKTKDNLIKKGYKIKLLI